MKNTLTNEQRADINEHAVSVWPNESCGLIRDDKYEPLINKSEDPYNAFTIAAEDLIKPYQVIVHSHSYHLGDESYKLGNRPEWPSQYDMEQWKLTPDSVWAIVACDGEGTSQPCFLYDSKDEDLVGRNFVFGVTDCASIVRDYYWQNYNYLCPIVPRQWDIWNKGQDLYELAKKDNGFVEVAYEDREIGDVLFMKINSDVVNHAGIMVGDNSFVHHQLNNLSVINERIDQWRKIITKVVRRK